MTLPPEPQHPPGPVYGYPHPSSPDAPPLPAQPPTPPAKTPRPWKRYALMGGGALAFSAVGATAALVLAPDGKQATSAAPKPSASAEEGWKNCKSPAEEANTDYRYRTLEMGVEVQSVTCRGNQIQVELSTQNWTATVQTMTASVTATSSSGCSGTTAGPFFDTKGGYDRDVKPESNAAAGFATMTVESSCAGAPAGYDITVTGSTSSPAKVTPSPTPTPTPSPEPVAVECTNYEKLSDREFKLLAKDPAAHFDKCYRVYGYVTQADSATGSYSFRANSCGEKHQPKYGYVSDCDTNSMFVDFLGESGIKDIVDGDVFEAEVRVSTPYTYTTTMGGQMTAPMFLLESVKQYASTK
ncbi:hypothetical protein [Streptomyces sp. NPDC059957]|uniref:hypothetical protein n=1 Tax=unclassified Streptomyces TaxID=2593676 RepID=UPI003651EA5E